VLDEETAMLITILRRHQVRYLDEDRILDLVQVFVAARWNTAAAAKWVLLRSSHQSR
jgi:hypothetical protein